MKSLKSIGAAQKAEVNRRNELAIKSAKLNHVKTRAGKEKLAPGLRTRDAKRTKTT